MDSKKSLKISQKFECESCYYITYKYSDYKKHLSTVKHRNLHLDSKSATMDSEISLKKYECVCKNMYKYESGYYKHKKKCTASLAVETKLSEPTEKELILLLLKDNKALQELVIEQSKNMMELCKNGTNNTTNTNSNNNITNKTFNLQFFLNEECKDALNISEFVSSIKMDLDDLEKTGLLGYVEGISNIINKNLNDLDETRRPIHCSDVKREVLYIKNDDQWIKENGTNKPVLTKAIKQVAHENIRQISEWRKKHPDCTDPDSKKNDLYLNIVSNAMSGITSEEQVKNYEKIITNVAKEVTIDKAGVL
jgi:hypothetical protein